MPDQDKESPNTTDGALEINKETLQDLDLEPADAENVKGGTYIIQGGSITLTTQNYLSGSVKGPSGPVSGAAPSIRGY